MPRFLPESGRSAIQLDASSITASTTSTTPDRSVAKMYLST